LIVHAVDFSIVLNLISSQLPESSSTLTSAQFSAHSLYHFSLSRSTKGLEYHRTVTCGKGVSGGPHQQLYKSQVTTHHIVLFGLSIEQNHVLL